MTKKLEANGMQETRRLSRRASVKKPLDNASEAFLSDSEWSVAESAARKGKTSAKRAISEMDDHDDDLSVVNDIGSEMTMLLQGFSNKINESLQSKRQKVKKYTEESTQATVKKVLETCKTQSIERRTVMEEFRKQVISVIENMEQDMDKEKEMSEKIQKMIFSMQKQMFQKMNTRKQQFQAIKDMAAEFFKGMDDLELRHTTQYTRVHNDLRKEMLQLQKKILHETQQQQLMQVRKNLQNIFG